MFDDFKEELLHKKFYTNFYWYRNIRPEFKQLFLDKLREDYQRIGSDEEFKNYIFKDLDVAEQKLYEYVLKYKDVETFDVAYKNYRLRRKNSQLKAEYEEVRNTHEELINSNSWKKTQSLRSLKK